MKIDKIVCASYGSVDSVEAYNYSKLIADEFNSEIVSLYVKPGSYYEGIEYLPTEESDIYQNWIDENARQKVENLEKISASVEIRQGAPYEEILAYAREQGADMIAVNRGGIIDVNPSISRTVVKLIRQSEFPVLTVHQSNEIQEINNILVPTGLFDMNSNDFSYALDLSEELGASLYHLHVLETAAVNYPAEVVERLRGDAYEKIAENDQKHGNVTPKVTEAKNIWQGISEFSEDNSIDLIIQNTYVGKKGKRHDFIGTVSERVIQTVKCPVITIRP